MRRLLNGMILNDDFPGFDDSTGDEVHLRRDYNKELIYFGKIDIQSSVLNFFVFEVHR